MDSILVWETVQPEYNIVDPFDN